MKDHVNALLLKLTADISGQRVSVGKARVDFLFKCNYSETTVGSHRAYLSLTLALSPSHCVYVCVLRA